VAEARPELSFAVMSMTSRARRQIDLLTRRKAALDLGVEIDAALEKVFRGLGIPALREGRVGNVEVFAGDRMSECLRCYGTRRQHTAHDQCRSPAELDIFHPVVEPVISIALS